MLGFHVAEAPIDGSAIGVRPKVSEVCSMFGGGVQGRSFALFWGAFGYVCGCVSGYVCVGAVICV